MTNKVNKVDIVIFIKNSLIKNLEHKQCIDEINIKQLGYLYGLAENVIDASTRTILTMILCFLNGGQNLFTESYLL